MSLILEARERELDALKNEVRRLVLENRAIVSEQLLRIGLYESALAQADTIFSGMPSRNDILEYERRRRLIV